MSITDMYAIETYKSLIRFAINGLTMLALSNGGAALAMVMHSTFAGQAHNIHRALAWYLAGLVICILACMTAYLTQMSLYHESVFQAQPYSHKIILRLSIVLTCLSVALFMCGAWTTIALFR